MLSLIEFLRAWRDFFMATTTAGAGLIGAMFVVISIGVGFLTRERIAGTHAYITSTVVHLGAAVLASLWTTVPAVGWLGFGIVLVAGGAAGAIYDGAMAFSVHRFSFDWTDYLWYTAMPLIGYVAVIAAGLMSLAHSVHTLDILAAAVVVLLICGVRNAWDMILIIVLRPRRPDDTPPTAADR